MNYLKIHDWDQHQEYKDGRPLRFIRVWVELLDKKKYDILTDAEFGQLVKIWLWAARNQNKIDNDPEYLKRKLNLTKEPNLTRFIELHFLDPWDSVEIRENPWESVEPPRNSTRLDKTRQDKTREHTSSSSDDVFGEFWKLYPKKVGKGSAQRAFSKIPDPKETLSLIEKALLWQRETDQWRREGGQFIPHPATYLNQRRWEDEPDGNKADSGGNDNAFLRAIRAQENARTHRGVDGSPEKVHGPGSDPGGSQGAG